MRYFTPDLLARFGSEDDAVADAANAEWEDALQRYREHWATIRPALPASSITLAEQCLHDARVVMIGRDPSKNRLSLLLQLEQPKGAGVMIQYELIDQPRVISHTGLEDAEEAPLEWQYDEMDIAKSGEPSHSILFTQGLELQLVFKNLLWISFPQMRTRLGNGSASSHGHELDSLLDSVKAVASPT